ncbi:hypothetical protein GH714_016489 [Hevea brasiliensis]|uniref:FAR1 domain-containing protein n=1 Tax=Hevea brasiliensis TaxID=3981 RepID=A0A6A6KJ68_HEVBR|nr:hypothetical protein GH714_016489 [Hevea brasiliensis]
MGDMNRGNSGRLIQQVLGCSKDDSIFNESDGEMNQGVVDEVDSLYEFYRQHARLKGFSVAKKCASKGRGEVYKYQTISCDKGRKAYAEKSSKKINCPARVNAILKDNGMWQVTKIISEHNHDMDPLMSRFMAGHRKITPNLKRILKANDICGIRPCKSIRILEVQVGGTENLICMPKDCRNFIQSKRRLRLEEGNAEAIRGLFSSSAW